MADQARGRAAEGSARLSHHEGTLLSLVLRIQPVTAYQVIKIYEESPVSNFNTSKGKIYPMIRRLADQGLLAKRVVAGDGRGTEEISCTAAGRRAVKKWVREIRSSDILIDDPLRTKVLSFDLLSPEERINWILCAKEQLLGKLDEVEAYGRDVDAPYQQFVHDNAVRAIRTRMDWLDRMLFQLRSSRTA